MLRIALDWEDIYPQPTQQVETTVDFFTSAYLQAETFLLPGKSKKISPPASSNWMQSKSLRCKNWKPRINRICVQAGNLVWAVYLFTYSICIATYLKPVTLGGEQSSKQTNLVWTVALSSCFCFYF